MSGFPDDGGPGGGALPGRDDGLPSARLCPGCGRSTADDVCLHCAAEEHFRTSSLVRGFLAPPHRQAAEWSPVPPPGPGDRVGGRVDADASPPLTAGAAVPPPVPPSPTDGPAVPPVPPSPTGGPAVPPVPPPWAARSGTVPPPTARSRRREEFTARGPGGVAASVAIALAAILLAAVVGIVGAVVTGPGEVGGPGGVPGPDAPR